MIFFDKAENGGLGQKGGYFFDKMAKNPNVKKKIGRRLVREGCGGLRCGEISEFFVSESKCEKKNWSGGDGGGSG